MIPIAKPTITKEEMKSVLTTLVTDRIEESSISGQFENELKKFQNNRNAVISNSLTGVIHLLFLHLGIGPGHKIFMPALLPVCFYDAVKYVGAEAVLYDSIDGFNTDREKILKKIDADTKLLVISSPFGYHDAVPEINDISVPVLEYGWGSLGTQIDGELIGSYSDYAVFSLNIDSIINTGYGGVIFTKDKNAYAEIKSLKNYGRHDGQKVKYDYRVSDILSALAIIQLQNIDSYIKSRRRIYEIYVSQFRQSKLECIEFPANVNFNNWCFPIRFSGNTSVFREKLRRKGVTSAYVVDTPLYSPFNLPATEFPVTDRFFRKHLVLPIYPSLRKIELERITKAICGLNI